MKNCEYNNVHSQQTMADLAHVAEIIEQRLHELKTETSGLGSTYTKVQLSVLAKAVKLVALTKL